MARDAARVLAAPRRAALRLDESTLHLLPQHWFVWDEQGRARCHCVVAFSKLASIAGVAQHNAAGQRHADVGWLTSPVFPRLYQRDEALYAAASASKGLCYRPENRTPEA